MHNSLFLLYGYYLTCYAPTKQRIKLYIYTSSSCGAPREGSGISFSVNPSQKGQV